MGIEATHPEYDSMLCEWDSIRDAYAGERCVKARLDRYLPPTTGMAPDWSPEKAAAYGACMLKMTGEQRAKYMTYIARAEFPDAMTEMVDTAMGLLWNKNATIELPKRVAYIQDNATAGGETLMEFMKRITLEQLQVQRAGVLIDMPVDQKRGLPKPYLCMYSAESIVNWDAGARFTDAYSTLNLVVLNESENTRLNSDIDPFGYTWVKKYRVLSLGPVATNESSGVYRYGQFVETQFNQSALQTPLILGRPIPFVPFYFINGRHCLPCVERPRAVKLANKCYSSYRTSADYEQQLHEQSQETLVLEGGDAGKKYAIGSGAVLCPPIGGDAKFIGLMGNGLPEMAKAHQNKLVELMQMSGQLVDVRSLQRESGEALATRVSGQTATLSSIATTLGAGMTRCLRDLALLLGADPKEVNIKPNTNFISPELFAKTLVELMQAKNMGYPILDEDLHRLAQERGISTHDFDTMMAIYKREPPMIMATGTPTANPGGKTPKQLTPPAPAGGVKSAENPTGISARGKTRTNSKKNKSGK